MEQDGETGVAEEEEEEEDPFVCERCRQGQGIGWTCPCRRTPHRPCAGTGNIDTNPPSDIP